MNKGTAVASPPLHCACKKGHTSIVEKLILAGANITMEDFTGKIPLELAKKEEIIEMLPKYLGEIMLQESM